MPHRAIIAPVQIYVHGERSALRCARLRDILFFRRGRDRNPRPHKTSYHPKLDVAAPPDKWNYEIIREARRGETRQRLLAAAVGIDRLINPRSSTRLGSARLGG